MDWFETKDRSKTQWTQGNRWKEKKKVTVRKQKKEIKKETERSKGEQKERKRKRTISRRKNIKWRNCILQKSQIVSSSQTHFQPLFVPQHDTNLYSFSIRPAAAAATARNHHFHHRALVPHWVLDAELVQKCVWVRVCVKRLCENFGVENPSNN